MASRIHQATVDGHDALVDLTSRLCAVPSVSAELVYQGDVRRCAELIVQEALHAGFHTAVLHETSGNPVVVANYHAGPDKPTVLVYTHYDVQPAGESQRWTSPPFVPTVRDGALWARGATDDKGHLAAHLKAIEILLDLQSTLPVNVILVSEGDEELGSPHFETFLDEYDPRPDFAIISDTPGFVDGHPALTTSLRGLVLFDITLRAAALDAHSGIYGGAIRNSAEELAHLLATLKDTHTGRILVPHFYDDVVRPSDTLRGRLHELPFEETEWLADVSGASHGEAGWSTLERTWWRPTLEIHSLSAGDGSAEVNTIVPGVACARLSTRLVADQDPHRIAELLRLALTSACPDAMTLEVNFHEAAAPVQLDVESPIVQLASSIFADVAGEFPYFVGMGGSVPPVGSLVARGFPCLMLGVAADSDNFHAPDEHIDLERLRVGTELFARLLTDVGNMDPNPGPRR